MAFFEILLYRTCTCKRKLTLCSVRLLILSSSPNNRASIWWLWFYSCFATLPLVVKDLLYTVHVHIHMWSCHDLCQSVSFTYLLKPLCLWHIHVFQQYTVFWEMFPPFIFTPYALVVNKFITLLIPTVSRRIQDGAELFASVEGKIYIGWK